MTDVLGGALGSLQGVLGNIAAWLQSWLDRIITPERRAWIGSQLHAFASERPLLAAFAASFMTFSGLPVALYVGFCVTVSLFALLVALLLALLAALAFILLAAGFALVFLLPVLFFTTFVAVSVWGWGLGLYYLFKWAGKDEVIESVDSSLKGLLGQGSANDHQDVDSDFRNDSGETKQQQQSLKNGSGHHSGSNNDDDEGKAAADSGSGSGSIERIPPVAKRHPGHKVPPGAERLVEANPTSKVSDTVSGATGKLA